MNSSLRPDTLEARRLLDQRDRVLSRRAILVSTAKQVRIDQPEAESLDAAIAEYVKARATLRRIRTAAAKAVGSDA